jgi:hypothetical protein
MKKLPLLTLIFCSICLLNVKVFAAILTVPSTEFSTIQAAVDAASAGETVQVAPGTYYEHIIMKSGVVIHGAGAGDDPSIHSIIDGSGTDIVITAVNVDSAAKLEGFKITNGLGSNAGGMYNENSSPAVTDCIFSGNSVDGYGGGMRNTYSSPMVTNCMFSNNTATASGGGMRNDNSSPTVTSCTFSEDSVNGYGGGMSNYKSSPIVSNCRFFSNSAGGFGGGMGNYEASPKVDNCDFSGNSTGKYGGGMGNNWYANPIVTNCTFWGNTATNNGGGMSIDGRCTPTVVNCILWGDSLNEIYNNDSTPIITYSDIQGGYGVTEDQNIDKDPRFVNAGGSNFHLKNGSPCIDAGTSEGITLPDTDFDGDPRIIGTAPDIGADESNYKKLAMPYIPLLMDD